MTARMGITSKLTLAFLFFAGAIIVGGGAFAYLSGRQQILDNVATDLRIISIEKQAALETWIAHSRMDVDAISRSPGLVEAVQAMMAAPPDSAEAREAHDRVVQELHARTGNGQPYLRWMVMDPEDGRVVADSDGREEGKYREDRPFFVHGRDAPFVQNVYYSSSEQAPAMTIGSPLKTPGGRLVGVVAARLDLSEMNTILQRRTGDRRTDDAFLVNTSSLFVTQPRLLTDEAVLSRGVHTLDVRRCLSGETDILQTDDFRGIPAIVAFAWLPEREMCLIVKVDQGEAFASVDAFGRLVILAGGLALLAAAGMAAAIARSITRPVRALQEGASRFGRGDLAARLPEGGGDELADLAREFNAMAAALSREHTQLLLRLERMYSLSSDFICVAGFDGYFKDVNPAAENMLGYSRQELLSIPYADHIHPEDRDPTLAALGILADGGGVSGFENRYRRKDGSWRWLLWNASADLRENVIYAMAHDVTDRKAADAALKASLSDLERSNRELEQFAYVASHDLQEPLRMVSSYTQLLARRYSDRLDQDAHEFIGYAVDGANRMQRLIQDLLAYSRVATRGLPFQAVDLHQVLGEAIANLHAAIDESRALVSTGDLPIVHGDRTQLVQLLQNLIGNSLKFRREEEPPRVHVSARRQGEEWILTVKDNGIGIDPQHFRRLFVVFQRLHGSREYPGTGIGLALCQRIVTRHGGRIWVESTPGVGSEFFFSLPAGSRAAAANGGGL